MLEYEPVMYFVDASRAEPDDRLVVELYGADELVTFKYVPGTPKVPYDRFVVVPEYTSPTIIDEAVDYYNRLPVMDSEPAVSASEVEVAFLAFQREHLDQRPQPQLDNPLLLKVRKLNEDRFMPGFTVGSQLPKLVKDVSIQKAE